MPEVQQAAKVLAKHNFAICIPHMHNKETGQVLPLPPGLVACERDFQVSFEPATDTTNIMVPVAWRWVHMGLEVCAGCCTPAGPEDRL
jgi:hypothetical protein